MSSRIQFSNAFELFVLEFLARQRKNSEAYPMRYVERFLQNRSKNYKQKAETFGICVLSSMVATTYSRVHHTTIGLDVFHFRVRNGIGWDNTSIIATTKLNLWTKFTLKQNSVSCKKLNFLSLSKDKWFISIARLSTLLYLHLQPINPVISGESMSSNLGVSFALICFQRLSIPNLATQQCSWQNNWYTRGWFIPVLSY